MKKDSFGKISILLGVILSVLCFLVACNDSTDLLYSVNADGVTCTITGIGSLESDNLEIPQKIGKYTVVAIADNAFSKNNFKTVSLPNSITKIGKGAFEGCSFLESINIPQQVTEIQERTFLGCTELKEITLPEGLTRINNYSFYQCENLVSVGFPTTLTDIGVGAFAICHSLSGITLPEGLKNIDRGAFVFCISLTEVYIPASVELIYMAFVGCECLENINVSSSNKKYVSIDGILYSYNNSKTILKLYPGGKTETFFTVPNHVIAIDLWAFAVNEHLQSITIPCNVKRINQGFIFGCENLNTINYEGTIIQWDSIYKHADWDKYIDEYVVYCTDGQISKDGTVTYK